MVRGTGRACVAQMQASTRRNFRTEGINSRRKRGARQKPNDKSVSKRAEQAEHMVTFEANANPPDVRCLGEIAHNFKCVVGGSRGLRSRGCC